MWDSESESQHGGGGSRDYNNALLTSSKHGVKTDAFEQRGNSWFVATDIPSDLLVQIANNDHNGDMMTDTTNFHLHKFPLLSRSGKMNRIICCDNSTSSSSSTTHNHQQLTTILIRDLPGASHHSFELAAKFCYGIAVDLTASNISALRCAAEYLEMTEDLEEGNLIFKTEAFLSYVVLSSWRDSILVLKTCEKLSPWAENLQIVRRCSESIAWKACANPKGIRWAYTGKPLNIAVSSPKSKWNNNNNIAQDSTSSPSRSHQPAPPDWWFEDVSILRIDHFVRVITAIKVKGMRFELIGAAIMHYASKWLPAPSTTTKDSSKDHPPGGEDDYYYSSSSSWKGGLHMVVSGTTKDDNIPTTTVQAKDQRMIIESLISIIPPQKDSVTCEFLLRLLRMANMLKVAPALVTELEKRVGMQFEQATLQDLLIPSYSKSDTLYDVDLMQRLLEHFLVQEQTLEGSSPSRQHSFSDKHVYDSASAAAQKGNNNPNAKARVARLVDSYLIEISRDRNLSSTKFQVLAEALPDSARASDDGLYRAIDSYLKAHPSLSEHERKRLCRVMDCQKLSMDACMHAAQNERLPLRVVVQVLFSEQVKISNALANNSLKDPMPMTMSMASNKKSLLEATPQSFQEGWAAAKKDINTLKFELETVKAKYLELQNEMETLQKQFDKIVKPKQVSSWTSGWKKLSKLTKTSNLEAQEIGSQVPNAEQARKAPRRWRNSIS